MIDLSNKFLFIHFRRTGGSVFCRRYYGERKSIDKNYKESSFGTGGTRHAPYKDYLKNFSNHDIESFYKVIIVRNPWDLLVSDFWAWAYPPSRHAVEERGRLRLVGSSRYWPVLPGRHYTNFREYLTDLLKVKARRLSICDLMHGCEDSVHIVRYENYDKEISNVIANLNMSFSCKRMQGNDLVRDYDSRYGISRKRPIDFREMYNKKTRDLAYQICKKDIKKFNYEF